MKNKIGKLITYWKDKGVFDQFDFSCNVDTNIKFTNISRAYGLIKVHKDGFSARILVSTINSPTYQLDKFISSLLNNYLPRAKHSIKNSYEFKKLKQKNS